MKVRDRRLPYGLIYMCNLKEYNKLVNKTNKQKKQTHREQTRVYQWGEGRGERREGRGKRQCSWAGPGGQVTMGFYEVMCAKLLKIVFHSRV